MFSAPQVGEKISSFGLSLFTLIIIMALLAFSDAVQLKSIATVVFGVLIIQLSYGRNLLVSLLSNKYMLLLGGASYALYIMQGPIRQWLYWAVDHAILPEKVASILNPVFAISLSVAIFVYWEEPTRNFLRNSYYKIFNGFKISNI
jgi:peptidoglycan/LPS O-acetylase OafA/YrhL